MAIAKIMQNRSFRATFGYCFRQPGAEVIGGNVAPWIGADGLSAQQAQQVVTDTTAQFMASTVSGQQLKRPVYHFSIALAPGDHLEDEPLAELCERAIAGRILASRDPSLTDQPERWQRQIDAFLESDLHKFQYAIVRHHDTKHSHAHVVMGRIDLHTGTAFEVWRDRYQMQKVLRLLEPQFGLAVQPNSWEVGRKAPPRGIADAVRQRLQTAIDQAVCDRPRLPELMARLQALGIGVRCPLTRTGKPKGISYELDGVAIAGHNLGNRYSYPGLLRRGCDYAAERDNPELARLSQRQPAELRANLVLDYAATVLERQQQLQTENERYQATWETNSGTLTIVAKVPLRVVAQAVRTAGAWVIQQSDVQAADLRFFQTRQRELEQAAQRPIGRGRER